MATEIQKRCFSNNEFFSNKCITLVRQRKIASANTSEFSLAIAYVKDKKTDLQMTSDISFTLNPITYVSTYTSLSSEYA